MWGPSDSLLDAPCRAKGDDNRVVPAHDFIAAENPAPTTEKLIDSGARALLLLARSFLSRAEQRQRS